MATRRNREVKPEPAKESEQRRQIADWAVTILVFLFGTTTMLQAFVVPTGSMEGTMLIVGLASRSVVVSYDQ